MNTMIEKILKDRYFIEGENVQTWLQRVAKFVASCEEDKEYWEKEFYSLMTGGYFLPNTPTLSNSGKKNMSLSACYVLPFEDNLDQLLDTVANTGRIFKSGGGVGVSGTKIRPSGALVKSSGGKASGPVSYLEIIDAMTKTVSQGGTRRGANMGTLHYNHPDIIQFITVKRSGEKLTQYNLSVTLDDAFMTELSRIFEVRKSDETYDTTFSLIWNDEVWISPEDVEYEGEVLYRAGEPAQIGHMKLWEILTSCAHKSGDPGVLFLDTANETNWLKDVYGEYLGTNPCGEQWLYPYDSCNLGSINVAKFFTRAIGKFNWTEFDRVIDVAIRFLDNVITLNYYPLPEIKLVTKDVRRIGLGVMGYANLFTLMEIPYDSYEAYQFSDKLFERLYSRAVKASEKLGEERGVFPAYKRSALCQSEMEPRRNFNVTTVAPTGTISMLIGAVDDGTFKNGCSSGIEPHFSLAFNRSQGGVSGFLDINQVLVEKLKERGITETEITEIGNRLANGETIATITKDYNLPVHWVEVFKTSHDILPAAHLEHQIIAQRYVDNSISKTINMSHNATVEDVSNIYYQAYLGDCKGITIYRDGSKGSQPLSNPQLLSNPQPLITKQPLPALSVPVDTSLGTLHTFTTLNPTTQKPLEVFLVLGRSGTDIQAFTEALGRLISIAMRGGISVEEISNQLIGIGGSNSKGFGKNRTLSVPDAVGRMLLKTWGEDNAHTNSGDFCPECHNTLVHEEGCIKCPNCGYTKC